MRSRRWSRRRLLSLMGTTGIGCIAGCNQPESPSETEGTRTHSPTPKATATESETASPTPTPESPTTEVTFDGGGEETFQEALKQVAEQPNSILQIESGTYRLDPADSTPRNRQRAHFEPVGLEDVIIEGNGAELVFTNPTVGMLHFFGDRNVTVRNLSLDYDPVPFTQGTILELNPDEHSLTLELDEGYPRFEHEMFDIAPKIWASTHRADGSFVRGVKRGRGGSDKRFERFELLNGRRYELKLSDRTDFVGLKPGRKLVVVARGGIGGVTAVHFRHIDGLTVDGLAVRASPGFAIQAALCTDPVIRNTTVAPPPDSDRAIGSDADGIHVVNCYTGPLIENCHIEQIEDDGIVVDTIMGTVESVLSQSTISVDREFLFTVDVGDRLEVMAPNGVRKGRLSPVSDVEYYNEGLISSKPADLIVFEESVSSIVSPGDYLLNLATASPGYQIRENVVRNNRASLIRASSGPGLIEDNQLEGSHKPAIEVQCDTSGTSAPQGWSKDLTIRRNQIARAGLNYIVDSNCAGVHVEHWTADDVSQVGRPHQNIRIIENQVQDCAHLGLFVEDTDDVELARNRLEQLNQLGFRHFLGKEGYGVGMANLATAAIEDNSLFGTSEQVSQFGWHRSSTGVTSSRNRLTIDGERITARLLTAKPISLTFDETVVPSEQQQDSQDDRPLAFMCRSLSLLDENGTTVLEANIGTTETGIAFGEGIWGREDYKDDTWRWFGTTKATLYFSKRTLERATTMLLYGEPMKAGISTTIAVDGQRTDSATFGTEDSKTYRISLIP